MRTSKLRLVVLDEALQKFQAQKRWSDVIKTTLEKAELVQEPAMKVALFADAGRMYLERSSNQAEAIKCYRRVLDFEPHNREALDALKDMYEKRRDWERLVEVMRAEADLLDAPLQPARRLELARLATERLRKPAICIDLWQDVLAVDESNSEAIGALANLYEARASGRRSRPCSSARLSSRPTGPSSCSSCRSSARFTPIS